MRPWSWRRQFSQCPDPLDAQQIFIDGLRDNKFSKMAATASLEYRFNNRTSLTYDAGIGTLNGTGPQRHRHHPGG